MEYRHLLVTYDAFERYYFLTRTLYRKSVSTKFMFTNNIFTFNDTPRLNFLKYEFLKWLSHNHAHHNTPSIIYFSILKRGHHVCCQFFFYLIISWAVFFYLQSKLGKVWSVKYNPLKLDLFLLFLWFKLWWIPFFIILRIKHKGRYLTNLHTNIKAVTDGWTCKQEWTLVCKFSRLLVSTEFS